MYDRTGYVGRTFCMRLAKTAHASRPWRIHAIAPDFELEDVWALPTPGGREDFPRLVEMATSLDVAQASSPAVRALFAIRWRVGELLSWDDSRAGVGKKRPTLHDRVPADLRGDSPLPDFDTLPFTPLYLTGDEFAAEAANETMHGVLHLGWVPDGDGGGGYHGQMAILVKRNGRLGSLYMAAIRPFRHRIVYPSLMREFAHAWRAA
jgi:hypothetical protein